MSQNTSAAVQSGTMDIQELDSGVPGDYINIRNVNVRRKCGGHPLKCLVVAFGLLCILQATLNISLRLYGTAFQLQTPLEPLDSKGDKRQEVLNVIGEHAKHGWLYFNNAFYFISSSEKSWTDSRNYCLQRNADLVVINSREEQDFITMRHGHSTSWIGLSMQGPQGNWQWVDGTNITLSYWGAKEPNAYSIDEDCAQILDNKWVDNGCFVKMPWVCEKTLTTQEGPQNPCYIVFPSQQGWEPFGGSLYYFSLTSKTWEESRDDCLQRNADLVVINTKEEQDIIQLKMGGPFWIGLSDRETEGEWKWVDGSDITFGNWGTNEPNGNQKEECVENRWWMLPNSWNDAICNNSKIWICEKVAGTPLLEGHLNTRSNG